MKVEMQDRTIEVSLQANEEITLRVKGGYNYRIKTPPSGLSGGLSISPLNFTTHGMQVEQVLIDRPGREGRASEVRLFV